MISGGECSFESPAREEETAPVVLKHNFIHQTKRSSFSWVPQEDFFNFMVSFKNPLISFNLGGASLWVWDITSDFA